MTSADYAEADRLTRKRARAWPALAGLFLAQQASFFATEAPERLVRTVDWFKFGGWLLLTMVLLAALATGGFWMKRREVRALLNDEVTRAHRADALSTGFFVAMLATVALYATAMFEPFDARFGFHVIATAGIATALVRFGLLERRALRDG